MTSSQASSPASRLFMILGLAQVGLLLAAPFVPKARLLSIAKIISIVPELIDPQGSNGMSIPPVAQALEVAHQSDQTSFEMSDDVRQTIQLIAK